MERQHVILYRGRARFTGVSEIEYKQSPEINSRHDVILFVRQLDAQPHRAKVDDVAKFHGWDELELISVGPLDAESLNDASMKVFRHHYEECLEHGDSLVWYQ